MDWVVETRVRAAGRASFSGMLLSAEVGGRPPAPNFGGFGVFIKVSGTNKTIRTTIIAP